MLHILIIFLKYFGGGGKGKLGKTGDIQALPPRTSSLKIGSMNSPRLVLPLLSFCAVRLIFKHERKSTKPFSNFRSKRGGHELRLVCAVIFYHHLKNLTQEEMEKKHVFRSQSVRHF